MPATPQQMSFSRGEWSPDGWYRFDLEGHDGACRLMHNCFPKVMGGAINRPGTQFISTVKNSANRSRLVPFVFSTQQSYAIEFGDHYARFYANVSATIGQVVVSGVPAWNSGTAYTVNSLVSYGGINYYCILANTNNTPPNTTYWYPLTGAIYEIPTPYAYTDLPLLKWDQSQDTLYLVHPSYPPATLTRSYAAGGGTAWTYAVIPFGPTVSSPTGVSITNGSNVASPVLSITSSTGSGVQYAVTAVVGGVESPMSNIIQAARGSVLSWTSVASATAYYVYVNGDCFYFGTNWPGWNRMSNSGANTSPTTTVQGNSNIPPPAASSANVFSVTTLDANGNESLPSNYCYGVQVTGTTGNTLSWTAPVNQAFKGYNIYCQNNGLWGFVAYAAVGQTSYSFPNGSYTNGLAIIPDTSQGIPVVQTFFNSTGNYPGCVAFYQNRLWYARTNNQPQTIWGSRSEQYNNFNVSTVIVDDDSVDFTINSRRVNEIKAIIPGTLACLIHTSGGVWAMTGGGGVSAGSAITPTSIQFLQQDFLYGTSDVKPITVGNNAVFPDHSGGRFRDITFNIYVYGYSGMEIGVRALHLFPIGVTAQEWDYQIYPYSIAWCIRSDGALIGLSYQKELAAQGGGIQLLAWHWHTSGTPGQSNDSFESVACTPNASNGQTDAWFIVKRTISGQTVRCVEYMAQREPVSNIANAWHLDCATQYSGSPQNAFTGLTQFANATVSVLADGVPYSGITVAANGSFTLPNSLTASVVLAGLPFTSELMPMQFDYQTALGTVQDKRRQIRSVFLSLKDTAQGALSVAPSNQQPLNYPNLYPWLQPLEFSFEQMNGQEINSVTGLFTGDKESPLEPGNITDGTIYLQGTQPLPWGVQRIVARIQDSER